MIHLQRVTIQNFLSYGNAPTTIEIDSHSTTLVVGRNGQGKSVVADAICYALFGRPYRNINKPQLINSINGKALRVEMDLRVNGTPYKIVRGMKPTVFEVYKEDKLVDQDAAMRDYQEYLEKVVLKTSFRTFTQVVILGSASHTPFMQLNSAARREVIEDVLDIGVFSTMNSLLKERVAATKEELNSTNLRLEKAHGEAKASQRVIATLEEVKKTALADLEHALSVLIEQREEAQRVYDELERRASSVGYDISKSKQVLASIKRLSGQMVSLEDRSAELSQKIDKQSVMSECLVCTQKIGADLNAAIMKAWIEERNTIEAELAEKRLEFHVLNKESLVWSEKYDQLQKMEAERSRAQAELNRLDKEILIQRGKIVAAKQDDEKLEAERQNSKEVARHALTLINRKEELVNERQIQDISAILLKDTGIRSAIIKEYLPLLNKLINKYLQHFEFFVNFTLDENFDETIKSRGRDSFSYANFSEGEKKRIDVALLFAFRQLAAAKNSVRCNLLFCDEIVDSSLDLVAREQFTALINDMPDTSTWVISHTDTNPDAYSRVIKVEKRGDFSYIDRIS